MRKRTTLHESRRKLKLYKLYLETARDVWQKKQAQFLPVIAELEKAVAAEEARQSVKQDD